MKQLTLLIALLGIVAAGCGSADPVVTKEQEQAYRNPPKHMPAAAAEGMKKGMEEARQRAQQSGSKVVH